MTQNTNLNEADEIDLIELWKSLWRGRVKIFLCGFIALLFGAFYAFFVATPVFQSQAKARLLMEELRAVGGQVQTAAIPVDDRFLTGEVSRVTSFDLLSRLVAEYSLLDDPEFNPHLTRGMLAAFRKTVTPEQEDILADTVDRLREHVSALYPYQSREIVIGLRSQDPEKAARLANALMEIYRNDQALSFYAKVTAQTAEVDALQQHLRESVENLKVQAELSDEELRTQLLKLEGASKAATGLYAYLLSTKTENGGLSFDMLVPVVTSEVISVARPARNKSAPRTTIIFLVSLVLGMSAGAVWVLFRGLSDKRVYQADELQKTFPLPVWGTLSHKDGLDTEKQIERIRDLRSSVLLSTLDKPAQVLLMTGTHADDDTGKLSVALAQSYASIGKKVLVIDANLRSSVLAGRDQAKGLLQVLTTGCDLTDAVQRSENVDVLLGAQSSAHAVDAFSSSVFSELISTARANYDTVLISSPPMSEHSDAAMMYPLSDACLINVTARKSRERAIERGLQMFGSGAGKPSGFVLLT